ncbi:MAG: MATE family efflux transporter [Oscillospiraceae bacterium]|nr:MATE family efflux transporter [Oscillospiraceae bacterium]
MGRTMNLTEGSIVKKMLVFSAPLIAGNLLQQLYTVADRVVVGRFAADGATALAAVGATAQPVNLVLGFFMGIATGASVICSNMLGSGDKEGLRKNMHTAVLLALLCGVAMSVITIPLVEVFLRWLGTPESVLQPAVSYMQLYMLGVPASLVYNVAAGIFRAHGDTKRPMYVLSLSGLVNVALNLVLVIGFHLDVVGVAVATVVSQYLSAGALTWVLFNAKDQYALTRKELRLNKKQVGEILRVGIPSGLGGIVFSASNLTIQTAVNQLASESANGAALIAGKTAANDINTFIYQLHGALASSCVNFAGQCYGAKKYKRIDKVVFTGVWLSVAFMAIPIALSCIFAPQVIGIFNSDPEVMGYGERFLRILTLSLLLFPLAECCAASSRGMRHAMMPTMMNLIAICGIRVGWVLFVFPHFRTIEGLYLSNPVSWLACSALQLIYYICVRRKLSKET